MKKFTTGRNAQIPGSLQLRPAGGQSGSQLRAALAAAVRNKTSRCRTLRSDSHVDVPRDENYTTCSLSERYVPLLEWAPGQSDCERNQAVGQQTSNQPNSYGIHGVDSISLTGFSSSRLEKLTAIFSAYFSKKCSMLRACRTKHQFFRQWLASVVESVLNRRQLSRMAIRQRMRCSGLHFRAWMSQKNLNHLQRLGIWFSRHASINRITRAVLGWRSCLNHGSRGGNDPHKLNGLQTQSMGLAGEYSSYSVIFLSHFSFASTNLCRFIPIPSIFIKPC
jgi:hypothetical protein